MFWNTRSERRTQVEGLGDAAPHGRVVKALVTPTLKLEQDQKVAVTLDPTRLHVFADEGGAMLSAAGADLFQISVRRG